MARGILEPGYFTFALCQQFKEKEAKKKKSSYMKKESWCWDAVMRFGEGHGGTGVQEKKIAFFDKQRHQQ